MIYKGDKVQIKPEWQDVGDDRFVWVAVDDEEKGRVQIMPLGTDLVFAPIGTVLTEWLVA